MSEVISFRLDHQNPRESKVLDYLHSSRKNGFSYRYIITECILRECNNEITTEQENVIAMICEAIRRIEETISEKVSTGLNVNLVANSVEKDLRDSFLDAVKKTIKPGMRID